MGGVLIIISIVVPTLLWADLAQPLRVDCRCSRCWRFGWIGFLDDYAKVTKQRNLGLSGTRKLVYQFIVGFCFAAALLFMRAWGDFNTTMNFPFFKSFQAIAADAGLMANPWTYVLGVAPFCIFVALVVVFSVQRGEPHRRPGRPGHRPHGDRRRRAHRPHLRRRPRAILPTTCNSRAIRAPPS